MNAFEKKRKVEEEGLRRLTPFFAQKSHEGRFVIVTRGDRAKEIQSLTGDVIAAMPDGSFATIEVKVEEERKTGNFFLETWSNRHWMTRGWMYTSSADWLYYYFLKEDVLYVMDFKAIKKWAFVDRHIWAYPEREQKKTEQLNDTWGACVPIQVMLKAKLAMQYVLCNLGNGIVGFMNADALAGCSDGKLAA